MSKMNIFVVEDNENRIKWFREMYEDRFKATMTFTDNIDDALALYIQNHGDDGYDIVFFDHDLGDEGNDEINNGFKIAQMLYNSVDLRGVDEHIVVHSSNPHGARNIADIFGHKADTIPFTQLVDWGVNEMINRLT